MEVEELILKQINSFLSQVEIHTQLDIMIFLKFLQLIPLFLILLLFFTSPGHNLRNHVLNFLVSDYPSFEQLNFMVDNFLSFLLVIRNGDQLFIKLLLLVSHDLKLLFVLGHLGLYLLISLADLDDFCLELYDVVLGLGDQHLKLLHDLVS